MVLEVEQSGVRWKTSILRSRSCTRIGKGWRQFVEGNGLEYGDRLLFTLVRVNRFVVQLFDASGRKKKIRQRKKRTLELSRDKKELSGDGKEEKKQQQQLDSLLNAAAATAAASGRKKKQLNELGGSREKYLGSLRSRQHTEKRRKEEVEEQLGKKKKTKTKVSRVHEVEYLSKRRTVTDEERGKAMIAARRCAGALCNPSFQIRMRDSAVYRRYLLVSGSSLAHILHSHTKLETHVVSMVKPQWIFSVMQELFLWLTPHDPRNMYCGMFKSL